MKFKKTIEEILETDTIFNDRSLMYRIYLTLTIVIHNTNCRPFCLHLLHISKLSFDRQVLTGK